MNKRCFLLSIMTVLAFSSCINNELEMSRDDVPEGLVPINLGGSIAQHNLTRAGESGFCDGDKIGTYIVDYVDGKPGTLLAQGNRADNLSYTYNEAGNRWVPAYDVYYKDKNTPVDIYGYYPLGTPESVEEYVFEVEKDQSRPAENGRLATYEQSDFLWAKAENKTQEDKIVYLSFTHRMAGVRVSLVEGEGFSEGEWAAASKQVLVQNTTRTATINLSTGTVSAYGSAPQTGIVPVKHGDEFRAIVVPQTVAGGKSVITATIEGSAYDLVKSEDIVYTGGKQHNFTLTINKRAPGNYEFLLSSESITVWENDPISHDGIAREYLVVNVETAGTLDALIAASGKEISKIKNLKLTGEINTRDFAVMRYKMTQLQGLNLKEVRIVEGSYGDLGQDMYYSDHNDDEIPHDALLDKSSLTSLMLPDKLTKIGGNAFANCSNLTGSLIIPEGVIEIENGAFNNCTNLNGRLSLPSTLKIIGTANGGENGQYTYMGVFKGCQFVDELKLPDSIEIIGAGTFNECPGFYGELRLPESIKEIGAAAFGGNYPGRGLVNMTGNITIPQGVTVIPSYCFGYGGFNGTLILHDGISVIGREAFAGTPLKGELRLPKELEVISDACFFSCDFSGKLVIPRTVRQIGSRAFAYNWRLMGSLDIPEGVLSIGAGAFAKCRSIEEVILPASLESIRYEPSFYEDGGVFQDCFGIGRIVCKGDVPAYVQEGAFHGVAKDNFTLEVPEHCVHLYQSAPGWKEFKRISAYRNLVIRPMVATAINTSVTRELVLTADEKWSVISQPDWVSLDKTSGEGKSEIKLTFAQKPDDGNPRSGEVVFKLDGKDYTTKLSVTQYDYQYAEDEVITLQSASKGNGVNLVFLGDGFNAKDISEGKLMEAMNEAYGHFFNIQPYKAYKDYFNVYTAVPVSAESGIGSVNTIVETKFHTAAAGGVTLVGENGESDYNEIFKYACNAPTVTPSNIHQTLIVMIPNTEDYGGICYMWDDGSAIAYCPMSDYGYPLDFRGVIQHEAGGHGFGKLGDEYIYHNAFISACSCTCCPHDIDLMIAQAKGWHQNLSLSGKMNEVPWRDFIFHDKYKDIVDIFEGGYMHNRGVYRSEQNSCMNNDIPYFSTISRYEIVKRIMEYAGEPFSFETFVENDVIEAAGTSSTSSKNPYEIKLDSRSAGSNSHHPVFMGSRANLEI